jgi:1,2-phenylacetyl-CoA epoxidase catalytic subunit
MNDQQTITDSRTAAGWMGTMVASLADNKASLGRRYAEWAVSAPTLESAVAAAAMAQDELGHARSTYPVLKTLGLAESDTGTGDRHLPLLDQEFPDWTTFIAANLVIDGALTTFVLACEASTVTQLSQRAKKIMQEEGSHRVHAEAWTRRICRAADPNTESFVRSVEDRWSEIQAWLGPDEQVGAAAALREGLIDQTPAGQRDSLRAWLIDLFAAEGVAPKFDEMTDWSTWDPDRRRAE